MAFFEHTERWFKGEAFEGGMLVIFGSLLVILALYFWRFGHTPTARVLVVPFLVVGLFWGIAAGFGLYRNIGRLENLRAEHERAETEFVRMSQKPIRISRAEAKRHTVDMTGKTIVITGATAGVGKETARSLARMGGNICFAARNRKKTLDTIEEIRAELTNGSVLEHKPLDLADLDSVRRFPSLFGENDGIDVLINNAGVAHETGVTKQGIERIFGINYLSHFLLTKGLLPHLQRASGRILNVTSMGHASARRQHLDGPFQGPCEMICQ